MMLLTEDPLKTIVLHILVWDPLVASYSNSSKYSKKKQRNLSKGYRVISILLFPPSQRKEIYSDFMRNHSSILPIKAGRGLVLSAFIKFSTDESSIYLQNMETICIS